MDLDFSSDQDELRDSIRSVLRNEAPIALARRVTEEHIAADDLWATFVELGWPALTVPEEFGGIGLGAVEAGILAEELGRVVAPGVLLPTVTQFVPLVRATGSTEQQAQWLGAVAEGTCRGTVAIAEASCSWDAADVTATASVTGDSVTLSGTKRFVFEAQSSDAIAVVARLDGEIVVVVVPTAAVHLRALDIVDGARHLADVVLDGVSVPLVNVLRSGSAESIANAIEEATVALALESVGACQSTFDISLDYAKERKQFGVPIGSFQAIKHKFADMLVALERARATAYLAALCIDEDDDRRHINTAAAKGAAGDAQRLLGKEGIQIHGGIGYTWEHDIHLYVKRAKSNEMFFGSTGTHRARIADLLGV